MTDNDSSPTPPVEIIEGEGACDWRVEGIEGRTFQTHSDAEMYGMGYHAGFQLGTVHAMRQNVDEVAALRADLVFHKAESERVPALIAERDHYLEQARVNWLKFERMRTVVEAAERQHDGIGGNNDDGLVLDVGDAVDAYRAASSEQETCAKWCESSACLPFPGGCKASEQETTNGTSKLATNPSEQETPDPFDAKVERQRRGVLDPIRLDIDIHREQEATDA